MIAACVRTSVCFLSLVGATAGTSTFAADVTERVDFSRDVRPILSDKCFQCHGPDQDNRQADLRLDVWESTDDAMGAGETIVVGEPDEGELLAHITSHDDELRMPPVASGKTLTPDQIDTIRRWVAEGAEFEQHWAFVAPQRPELPAVTKTDAVRNAIDAIVLARLETVGLNASPRAAPIVLLRRMSLDLIGLPPTISEVDEFQQQVEAIGFDEAYRRAITRLLASPHYGERWGRI